MALTRGRESNHLYLAANRAQRRDEFAPQDPDLPDPIAQLAHALSKSNAQTLAIDGSRLIAAVQELHQLEAARTAAERDESDAARVRRLREARASRWRPKTRRDLDHARAAEAAAAQRTSRLRKREQAQADRVRALQDEQIGRSTRNLQRRLERGRDLGRSAER
jgi:hypothetical protein